MRNLLDEFLDLLPQLLCEGRGEVQKGSLRDAFLLGQAVVEKLLRLVAVEVDLYTRKFSTSLDFR